VREDKKSNWVCVLCKTVGSCKNTSNQWKHLELHHKEIWEELKGKKQPPKKRRREDDNSNNLLDNDSGRIEDDADAVPSTSDSAAADAGPSATTSASAAPG
jgi:hypothetical protein